MDQVQRKQTNGGYPHIVFLYSDTGGGHRSAAQAIIEALETQYPGQTTCDMVDIFRDYAPPLLAHTPDIYPPLSRKPWLLGGIFHLSNGAARTRVFLKILWPYIRMNLYRLIREHPADLFVSVHPLIDAPLGNALDMLALKTPFVTVVTDLVTIHATWYWKRSNLVIVPTEAAFACGIKHGFPPDRMRVVGLPVSRRYRPLTGCRQDIRARLGWPKEPPAVLLVGGGEGTGPLERIANAIDDARLPITLVIIAGRNQSLKGRLEGHPWNTPVRIYGFIQNMPEFMSAADILVTKAGPGTISEGLASGLPLILYSRLNGPEDGNVGYVVKNGAGVWAPQPEQVVNSICDWLEHPEKRSQAAQAGLSLARPQAASEITHLLLEQIIP